MTDEITPTDENVPVTESESTPTDESKTFDAEYVSGLKQEAIDNRREAKSYATRLHAELVRATGRLADPNDLEFDAAHLEDADALNSAIGELLARKPHFAARTPQGNVGQGVKDQAPTDWVSQLKALV